MLDEATEGGVPGTADQLEARKAELDGQIDTHRANSNRGVPVDDLLDEAQAEKKAIEDELQKRGKRASEKLLDGSKTWLNRAARKLDKRAIKILRRLGKLGPGLGALLAILFFPSDAQAKGLGPATGNALLDATPIVGTAKGIGELLTDQDLIPDLPQEGRPSGEKPPTFDPRRQKSCLGGRIRP